MDLTFSQLVVQARDQRGKPEYDQATRLLCFDPGHTTGWAFFLGTILEASGQIKTRSVEEATPNVQQLYAKYTPHHIVLEDYRVYKWRQKHHVGSELTTTQVIGCIETFAALQIPPIGVTKQPANIAKNFCTNEKLKAWGFIGGVSREDRHAHDAIRHGTYFILFGTIDSKQRRQGKVG